MYGQDAFKARAENRSLLLTKYHGTYLTFDTAGEALRQYFRPDL